jgi:hypothetical protein
VSRTVFGVIQGLHYSENSKGINYTALESKSNASFVESLRGLLKYSLKDKIANFLFMVLASVLLIRIM